MREGLEKSSVPKGRDGREKGRPLRKKGKSAEGSKRKETGGMVWIKSRSLQKKGKSAEGSERKETYTMKTRESKDAKQNKAKRRDRYL